MFTGSDEFVNKFLDSLTAVGENSGMNNQSCCLGLEKCLYPGCGKSAYLRGLCGLHLAEASQYVRQRKTTWREFEIPGFHPKMEGPGI